MANGVEISVIIPCLNEEKALGTCLDKIADVFSKKGYAGEIIVVDNGSTDRSAQIAKAKGAKVIYEKVLGYGSAYLSGLKQAEGKYIVMGDGDNTYDFEDIPKFIDLLKKGYELVMGSRFKGKIHKQAMPWANRHIGNPILSGMCRLFFHTSLSDIHCGLRAISKEAYNKMNLQCLGMEFATEMVVEALNKHLKITEVAIDYYPRWGSSKLHPIQDAWRHIRFMFLFCPTWLYLVPGATMGLAGILILSMLLNGPFLLFGHYWDIHMMVLGALLSILGYQIVNMGIQAKTLAFEQGYLTSDNLINKIKKHYSLELGLALGFVMFLVGLVINILIFVEWWRNSFGPLYRIRESVFAMTFMVLGLQTIFSSFFLSFLSVRRQECK
jgi:glycosyltransferase involved in cell wall biosynthesis